jgi:putative flippase GtrA
MSARPSRFARFVLSGGVNTFVTYLLYLVLLRVLSARLSYTIAFICGIGLAYILSRYFIFRAPGIRRSRVLFTLVYLAQYIIGLVVVSIWVDLLALPKWLAPVAVIAVTLPLTYQLSRRLFPTTGEYA